MVPVTAGSHTKLLHLRERVSTSIEEQLTPGWIERYLFTVEFSPQDAAHVDQLVLTKDVRYVEETKRTTKIELIQQAKLPTAESQVEDMQQFLSALERLNYHSESSLELQPGFGRIITISYCI